MLTKTEITAQLQSTCRQLTTHVQTLPAERFVWQPADEWSAAGYLQHLIITVKGTAKGMQSSPEALERLFGRAVEPSRPYDTLIATYMAGLAAGFGAPAGITPLDFRFPEGVTDTQAYLIGEWNTGNDRLTAALIHWAEADLDVYRLPHPGLGMLTLREMLYFTMHHNLHHLRDIQRLTDMDWQ